MPLNGTVYTYGYNHQRKEVFFRIQIGTSPVMEFAIGAEAFIYDLDFIRKDTKLSHFISEVRKRKELPTDFDFGSEAEIKFDADEWGKKMRE